MLSYRYRDSAGMLFFVKPLSFLAAVLLLLGGAQAGPLPRLKVSDNHAFRNRWRDFAVPIYERHGPHSAGWWVPEKEDAGANDQFISRLAAESSTAIQSSIAEFHKDTEWQRVEKETERDGQLRSGVTADKLTPTDLPACE